MINSIVGVRASVSPGALAGVDQIDEKKIISTGFLRMLRDLFFLI